MIPGLRLRLFLNFNLCIWMPVLLIACGVSASSTDAVYTPVPTCVMLGVNPYQTPSSEPGMLYAEYKNGTKNLDTARQTAFSLLAEHVKLWSDYLDVQVTDTTKMRLTVTYIDPALIQYVILNHAFMNSMITTNIMDQNVFAADYGYVLDKISRRNELLFLVTITPQTVAGQVNLGDLPKVTINFTQMTLINSSNVQAYPTHDDHLLSEPIDLNRGAVSGYIWFPISILDKNNNCLTLPDTWTTSLTLNIPKIEVGGKDIGVHFWSIPFAPLIERGPNHPFVTSDMTNGTNGTSVISYDIGRISPISMPPQPMWNSNDVNVDSIYWQDMSRYIWYWTMNEGRH